VPKLKNTDKVIVESFRCIVDLRNSVIGVEELYSSPQMRIIEIKVEMDFATSPVDDGGM
jgi:hypothetical protein